jgi:Aspartyl protease
MGFLIHTKKKRAEWKALLDTGATECFIHPHLVKSLNFKEHPLTRPQHVRNIDRTINQAGKTTTGVCLVVKYQGKPQEHLFFVTNIGEDDVILGYPFFKAATPHINWKTGELMGKVQALEKGNKIHSIRLAKTTTATQLAIQVPREKKTWD